MVNRSLGRGLAAEEGCPDGDGQDALDQPLVPHDLPHTDGHEEHGEEQQQERVHGGTTAQLHGIGVAEEGSAGEQAARTPVAEDHGGEADVAAATGLAVSVDVRGDEGEEAATEAREATGDDDGEELVAQHVDTERLRRDRRLTRPNAAAARTPSATGPTRSRRTAAAR